jgi:UDP-hydrolysing UDP-N-acetyl-D-glucosamine 2-epimerase
MCTARQSSQRGRDGSPDSRFVVIVNVLAITGSRADYGLLSGPLKAIRQTDGLDLKLAITGSHVSPQGTGSRADIVNDGFEISAEIDPGLSGDSPRAIAEATGRITTGAARVFAELDADIALVLGDRYEMLAVATAAALMEIPIAHIHGGEATLGAIDDSLRNAITKLAGLHFASAEPYRNRIIQMGESPDRVFNVGAPGVEQLLNTPRAEMSDVWARLGCELPEPFVLVTYHPETAGNPDPAADVAELLAALSECRAGGILFTGVNADARHNEVDAAIRSFVTATPDRSAYIDNMGQRLYWTAMARCAAVVGNSSSGIIEAPSLAVPTVNIGTRQGGRLRTASVIDCAPVRDEILHALDRAIDRDLVLDGATPYGGGETSARIADELARVDINALSPKPFHDMVGGRAA